MSEAAAGIIVLGFPRSGTTLMRRILGAHPNIACPPETNLLSAASRFLDEHQFAGGLAVGVVPGLEFSGYREAQVLQRTRDFVLGFFNEIAAKNGKKRWAEKTAVDIFHIDAIERLFGDSCQYVCMVRHPLDVVCSVKELSDKMEMYLPELHAYVARYLSPIEAIARAWVDTNARLQQFSARHPERCHLVRYESLTADPAAEVDRLFTFLGEEIDARTLLDSAFSHAEGVGLGDWKTYETKTVSRESVGRHAGLDDTIVNRLAGILNPLMVEFGYDAIAGKKIASRAQAQRQYELSRMVAALSKNTPPR